MASLRARLTRQALRIIVRPRYSNQPIAVQRRRMDAAGRLQRIPRGTAIAPVVANGVPGEWVIPSGASPSRVIYFLHGGGYSLGSLDSYRAFVARLAVAASARAFHIDYRLAPEHKFPAAVEDALAGYRWLIDRGIAPRSIVLAGDSAGGGLSVALLVALRDARDRLPAAAVLLSPWTDLAFTGASLRTRANADPIFGPTGNSTRLVERYLGELDPRTPLASPLYADLRGLPPLLIHVGTDEMILDDSTRLADRARAAGVEVTLKIWPGLWHVFQMIPFLPESGQSLGEIGAFIQESSRMPAPASANPVAEA
jgi:monoterpene epsilon-lactone hydrolase